MSAAHILYLAAGLGWLAMTVILVRDLLAERRTERKRQEAQRTVIIPVCELERQRRERLSEEQLRRGTERLIRDVLDSRELEVEMAVDELVDEIEAKGVEGLTGRQREERG